MCPVGCSLSTPELINAVAVGVGKWSWKHYLHAWCLSSFQYISNLMKHLFLIHVSPVE